MPQPDFALLRPREDFYIRKHPGVDDIFLMIELSDSSLEYDTTVKLSLYAVLKIHVNTGLSTCGTTACLLTPIPRTTPTRPSASFIAAIRSRLVFYRTA
jgi:hypothetical protein